MCRAVHGVQVFGMARHLPTPHPARLHPSFSAGLGCDQVMGCAKAFGGCSHPSRRGWRSTVTMRSDVEPVAKLMWYSPRLVGVVEVFGMGTPAQSPGRSTRITVLQGL